VDIFLLIGIFAGVCAVGGGLLMKGVNVSILFSPEAMLVILVGTTAAIMNSFTQKEFLNIPKLFGAAFGGKKVEDPVELINQISNLAQVARKNGLLSLESMFQDISNDFLKRGLQMAVDGIEMGYIREVLTDEIEAMEERHRSGASIFATAGGASPTLGVLGAAIGLIGALGNLSDTSKLGESIASAFIATIYGIFFGYVIWHPLSSRLKRKSAAEISNKLLILEGVIAVQEGRSPKTIEQKLSSMLSPKTRMRFEDVNRNGQN